MSRFFINRPIVAIVIALLTVIVGGITLVSLPVSQFPAIAPPEVQVQTTFVGADAQTVEQSVATPIEQQMSGVDNLNYMYSVNSSTGEMRLIVDFDVQTEPNTDLILTQLRQSQAASQLPVEVTNFGVTVQKTLTAPLMLISLYSPSGVYDSKFLANYAYINLNDQLTRVPGIGSVQVFGAGRYAMRLWVKPDQLAKLAITVPDIVTAIQSQNTVNPAGQIGGEPSPKGQEFTYSVRAQGRLTSPEEFEQIVVRAAPDGGIVRVKDVARVELGAQDYTVIGHLNGRPSAIVAVYQLPGSNAVQAAEGVKSLLAEQRRRLPSGVDYTIALDTTRAVTEGIKEIVETLLIAIALLIVVVYLFLQGWRATLIPLLAVPVSLVGTFVVFPAFGFSINTLSLFGLVLAIGLVVDDAIVVVEAVEHHIEAGLSPRDATFKAMEEISAPVVGIALVLSAVFIPTAFIPGITGRLYQQFAVTIAISVCLSAFNALTLSPALAALLLRPRSESRGLLRRFFEWFNRGFARATDGYVRGAGALIRKSVVALALLVACSGLAAFIGTRLPSSFLPDEDQGYMFLNLQLPSAASLQRTEATAHEIEELLAKTSGVESTTSVIGFSLLSLTRSSYNAFFFVTLKEWKDRRKREEQYQFIRQSVNQKLAGLRQGIAFSFSPPAIPGVGTSGGFTFVLEDRSGSDVAFLARNTDAFISAARKRPEFASVVSTFLPNVPQQFVVVDRDKVLKQGVDIKDVYRTIQTFMGGSFINYFNRFGRQWQVYVEAEGAYRDRAENVGEFFVRNRRGDAVPLSALTKIESRSGPEFTLRHNLYRSAQIIGGAAPGYSSAQAMAALEEVFAATMPPEMGYDYLGISFQEKRAQQGISPSSIFGFSLLVVFLVLAALYESWSLPLSVLLSTPVAVFGAFVALWLRRVVLGFFLPPYMVQIENDVYSQIGLVMLIGLTAKNAILIVEFAKNAYEGGQPLADAALAAARLRLRPILMTSFAFVLGCVPLWTASGAGSVARQIMGTTVIGGMLAATLIAVFIIPVLFVVVERIGQRRALGVSLLAALSSGCVVGPTYKPPAVPTPSVYRGGAPAQTATPIVASFGDQKWWDAFQDEALRDLVRSALQQNYDVRIAAARILEARALLGITRADQLPNASAAASAVNGRLPEAAGRPAVETNAVQVGASVGWELDFWGKFRRATEAARAALLSEEWAQRHIVSSLVSDVASAYFQLSEQDLELEISRRTLASRTDSLRLTQLLADRGATSMLDVRQAEQLVFDAGASIPDLEQRIEQQENFISVLVGRNPQGVIRGRRLVDQPRPPEVPAGLPSSLLERRPDILQAEQQLIAANAQIGVAKADLFPRISLTAAGGFQSSALTSLFSGPAGLWTIGAGALQPVFEGGRIRNRVRFAEAHAREATFVYQRTVQQAFRDVSDALVAYRKSRDVRSQQEQLTNAAEDATRLSNMRYRGGAASYLEVLDSETRFFAAQRALAQAEGRELLSLVQIYRALGGGWQQ